MTTGNHLRHLKKKLQETSTYCVQYRKKWVTYVGSTVCSYFLLTENDLGVMGVFLLLFFFFFFFSENCDKTDEVCAEIPGCLKFGILGLY